MSNVWKRLQRVGKKAAKFNIKTNCHELSIECTSKWQPNKITILFTHRDRKKSSKSAKWEPISFKNIYDGKCIWNKNDSIEFNVTLYKGNNDDKYEAKEWSILIEDEDSKGKKRVIATGVLNIDTFTHMFNETEINLKLKLLTNKILNASLKFFLIAQLLKEGKATDDDMISLQSYASTASSVPQRYTQELDINEENDDIDFETFNNNEVVNSKLNLKNILFEEINNFTNEKKNEDEIINNSNIIQFNKQISKVSFESLKFDEIFEKKTNNSNNNNNNNNNQMNITTTTLIDLNNVTTTTNNNNINDTDKLNPFHDDVDDNNDINELNPFHDDLINEENNNNNNNTKNDEVDKNNPFFNDIISENNNNQNNCSFLQQFENELNENKNNNKSKIIKNNNFDFSFNNNNNNENDNLNTMDSLLNWCKNITKFYKNVNIENFSTSWKNGLAFCAIIDYFRPELINFNSLNPNESLKNLKKAFDASDLENIQRAIQIADLTQREVPDKLSVMTYVYQLKEHFEKNTKKILNESNKIYSSPKSSPIKESTTIHVFNKLLKHKTKHANSVFMEENKTSTPIIANISSSPTATITTTNTPISNKSSKKSKSSTISTNILTPAATTTSITNKDTFTPIRSEISINKSRKYLNPFDSDDDEENTEINRNNNKNNNDSLTHAAIIEIKQNGQIINAVDTIDVDGNNSSNNSSTTNTMRSRKSSNSRKSNEINPENDYRQRARQLIQLNKQQTTSNSHKPMDNFEDFHSLTSSSPSSPSSPISITSSQSTNAAHKPETIQLAKKMIADAKKRNLHSKTKLPRSASTSNNMRKIKSAGANDFNSLDSSLSTNDFLLFTNNKSTMSLESKLINAHESNDELTKFDKTKSLKTPNSIANNNQTSTSLIGDDYIQDEMNIIDKEQAELDEKAIVLEKNLRKLMKSGDNKKQEDLFIREWFLLVNKKNSLIHRQLELEILQKEKNLQKRFDLLNKQLQNLMEIDDSKKSEEQKKVEKNLLKELVALVDQRNEIVVQLDEENRNLESEQEIDNFIKNRPNFNTKSEQKGCILQ